MIRSTLPLLKIANYLPAFIVGLYSGALHFSPVAGDGCSLHCPHGWKHHGKFSMFSCGLLVTSSEPSKSGSVKRWEVLKKPSVCTIPKFPAEEGPGDCAPRGRFIDPDLKGSELVEVQGRI